MKTFIFITSFRIIVINEYRLFYIYIKDVIVFIFLKMKKFTIFDINSFSLKKKISLIYDYIENIEFQL